MTKIKILYFAAIKETIGKNEETISLPTEIKTISQFIDWLFLRHKNFATNFKNKKQIRVAIDCQHVEHKTKIKEAKEIAIFPPMSGG